MDCSYFEALAVDVSNRVWVERLVPAEVHDRLARAEEQAEPPAPQEPRGREDPLGRERVRRFRHQASRPSILHERRTAAPRLGRPHQRHDHRRAARLTFDQRAHRAHAYFFSTIFS
mgnify:CR=1 FL=1